MDPLEYIASCDRGRILTHANTYLLNGPITITAIPCVRSSGTVHDFYSEGDYWWPDPTSALQPYVRRDGLSNPNNFSEHRRLLIEMSTAVASLTAAWRISKNESYAHHACRHLMAWFVDGCTRMNPSLHYAQAIKGRVTGRGFGIVDTVHLAEVSLAIEELANSDFLKDSQLNSVKCWFGDYIRWLTRHPYGIEEKHARNNHSTCWLMQIAAFSRLVGEKELVELCRERFKSVIVPTQFARDGSFPFELLRTRPYNYSLFNLELMAAICQLTSTEKENLWHFQSPDGRGVKSALDFMVPYIADKSKWPFDRDVVHHEEWPMRHSSLLFGGIALNMPGLLELWKLLKAESSVFEVKRNFFIRQPLLWFRS